MRSENVEPAGVDRRGDADAERARLARDLHDGLAQDLWFMNVQITLLQDALRQGRVLEAGALAEELRQALEWSYAESRSAIAELQRPPTVPELTDELRRLAELFTRWGGATVELDMNLPPTLDLAPAVVSSLLRLAREALANVGKHATATRVRVRLAADQDEVRMMIEDDGRGFDPGRSPEGGHLGLGSMRARARALRGALVVWSQPARGTTLYLRVPIPDGGPTRSVPGSTEADAREDATGAFAAG